VCLIVGNEVEGVSQALIDCSDHVIEIPQVGTKHSLNVTVATGIALWEIFKQYYALKTA
jgi:tRNA G18 (ribose-2'-O)-methylase SpoU